MRSSRGPRERSPRRAWFVSSIDRQPGPLLLARDRRLFSSESCAFSPVESFALTNLRELGLAEPTARAPAKRLGIAPRRGLRRRRVRWQRAGGAWVANARGSRATESLIRAPGEDPSSTTLVVSRRGTRRRWGTAASRVWPPPTDRADHTVRPVSVSPPLIVFDWCATD